VAAAMIPAAVRAVAATAAAARIGRVTRIEGMKLLVLLGGLFFAVQALA
jgi:hypothetical protein